ncbi:MAG: XRE family transcriptional regulator [Verrucomicrobia bacterium]|nr:XRE family transcriptional regulator [Verrucomicrobiota bacterium]
MNPIRYVKGPNPYSGLFPKELSPGAASVSKKLAIANRLIALMKEQNVSRSELAARMGVQPSRITAMLEGTGNLTIDTLVRAGMALGAELHQTFAPVGNQVKWVVKKPAAVPEAILTSRVAEEPKSYRVKKSR